MVARRSEKFPVIVAVDNSFEKKRVKLAYVIPLFFRQLSLPLFLKIYQLSVKTKDGSA